MKTKNWQLNPIKINRVKEYLKCNCYIIIFKSSIYLNI